MSPDVKQKKLNEKLRIASKNVFPISIVAKFLNICRQRPSECNRRLHEASQAMMGQALLQVYTEQNGDESGELCES